MAGEVKEKEEKERETGGAGEVQGEAEAAAVSCNVAIVGIITAVVWDVTTITTTDTTEEFVMDAIEAMVTEWEDADTEMVRITTTTLTGTIEG